ncbi:hypothetical protein F4780DRAFT_26902 [Xylariomycetidae sp. FL0641]|nr:hypothetical protein F4780DRAFT_26902 [Xylariomycetidae sp. FL0641]
MRSPPATPSNRRQKRPAAPADPESPSPSPTKRARTPRTPQTPRTTRGPRSPRAPRTPGTPTKAALGKAKAENKRRWKAEWEAWVAQSRWVRDENYRQKVGSIEIHKTDAKKYYGLKDEELDTLPYKEFPNDYNPRKPGRSYPHDAVCKLAYRKLARLAGVHEKGEPEAELLRQGQELFEARKEEQLKKNPGMPRIPKTGTVIRVIRPCYASPLGSSGSFVPGGTWESPVYENGRVVGSYRNYQFDPEDMYEDEEEVESKYPNARFRPFDSDDWQ